MKKNDKNKSPKRIKIDQSMDDITKDKIILVDKDGNTLGEVDRQPKKETEPEVRPVAKKSKKRKKVKADKRYGSDTHQEERPNHIKRRKLSLKERRKRKRRAIAAIIAEWVLGLAILIIGGILFAFFFCKVENVVVEGNTIYEETELKNAILDGKYADNCVYDVVHNIFHPKKDIAFVEKASVSMSGLNTLKITITERIPLAYIMEGTPSVPEANSEQNANGDNANNPQQTASQGSADETVYRDDTYDPDREGDAAATSDFTVEEANNSNVRDPLIIKYFNEDGIITDISNIQLSNSTQWVDAKATGEKVGDVITNDSVSLDSFLVTAKALKANNVFLDTIRVDDNHIIFGTKNEVKINFGLKNDMDDKCKRLSKILPQLENQRGTLHLENFSPENTDIVFKKES